MKQQLIIPLALLLAAAGYAQPAAPLPGIPGAPPGQAVSAPAREPANYLIRVEWTDPQGGSKSLEVLTTEGTFDLSTIQKTSVKINNNEVPTTLKFNGTIKPLDDTKGRLQLFLGRTVPYVTGSTGGLSPSSTYSQMSVGLESTFVVKFGKPLTVQNDENGQISVLVKRLAE